MSVALIASGAFAYSAAAGASVAPAYPAGIVAGNGLLLLVGQKPSTANGGTCSTPAGWTPIGSITGAGGYGTGLAADTGNTNLFAFFREAAGTFTLTMPTNDATTGLVRLA